jgi:hypothetical protein
MDKIEILKRQIDRVSDIKKGPRFSSEFKKWHRDTEVAVEKVFGAGARHVRDFQKVQYNLSAYSPYTPDSEFVKAFREGLDDASSILQSFIDELIDYGLETMPIKNIPECEPKATGKEQHSLISEDKLKNITVGDLFKLSRLLTLGAFALIMAVFCVVFSIGFNIGTFFNNKTDVEKDAQTLLKIIPKLQREILKLQHQKTEITSKIELLKMDLPQNTPANFELQLQNLSNLQYVSNDTVIAIGDLTKNLYLPPLGGFNAGFQPPGSQLSFLEETQALGTEKGTESCVPGTEKGTGEKTSSK